MRRGLIGLLLTSGIWAFLHVGVLLAPGLDLKTAVYKTGLIVGFGTVWAWLWLCSAYSGRSLHRSRTAWTVGLSVIAVVTLTKLTNPWHGLYFSAGWASTPFPHLRVDYHVLHWITTALSYALAMIGFFMLIEPLRQVQTGAKALVGLFGLTALPLGINVISYVEPSLPDLSHEPVGVAAFSLGALYAGGVRWFERTAQTGQQQQPALVLSKEGRIRNYNERAARLFSSLQDEDLIGTPLAEGLPRLASVLNGAKGEEEILEMEGSEGETHYVRPAESAFRSGIGRLVLLTDVTEQESRRHRRMARLEALFEGSPDMISVHDGEGNILRANPRFCEKTGYQETDLDGMKVEDLETSSSGENAVNSETDAEAWRTMEAGDRRRIERTYQRKDGTTFPVEVHLQCLRLNGEDRVMAISRDITERKRAEEELARERDRLETLFENLPTPVVRCRAREEKATITGINPAFSETFDLEPDKATGKDLNDLLVPTEQKEKAAEIDRRALTNGSAETEVRRVTGNGLKDFQLQVAGHQPDEGPPEMYAIYTDITDQKRRERRLRQAETLFQNAQDGLFLIDVERTEDGGEYSFTIQRVNPAYEEETGLREADLRGRSPRTVFGEGAGSTVEERYRDCARRQEPIEYEEEVTIGGEVMSWRTRVAPVVVDGETQQIVGTTRDVTEAQRRKQKLERQNDLFERAQDIADVGAWEYDVEREEIRLTDEAYRIHGLPPGSGMTPEQSHGLYHPEDRPEAEEAFRRAIRDGEPYDIEARLITEEGKERWIRTRGQPQWEDGKVVRVRGAIQDITEQKRHEQALQAAKGRYQTLVDNFPGGGVFLFDEELTYTLAGGEKVDVVGSPEEIIGATVRDLVPDELVQEQVRNYRRALKGERGAFEQEYKGRWYRIRTLPVKDEDGKVISGMAVSQDITERRRREETLRRRREQIETLYETANRLLRADSQEEVGERLTGIVRETLGQVGVTVHLVQGDELRVNHSVGGIDEGASEQSGLDIDGQSAAARAHRSDETMVIENVEGADIDGFSDSDDVRSVIVVPMDDQGTLTVAADESKSICAFERHMVEVLGTYGAAVLDRLEKEQALREERDLLDRLLEISPDAIVRLDRDGRFVQASGQAAAVLGIDEEEIVGRAYNDPRWNIAAPDGEEMPDDKLPFARIVRTGEPVRDVELSIRWPDGTLRLLSVSGAPLYSEGEEVEEAVFYLSDVTEQKRREQALRDAKKEAEEAKRIQSAFLANMSHEIRTPLTSIIGFAEAVGTEADNLSLPSDSSLREHAEVIEQSGKRLLDTLEGVLNLSQLEAGQMELGANPVDVANQARWAAEELSQRAQEKSIDLRLQTQCARAQADEGGIQIVLRNLVSNAIKHTEEGGAVWIRTRQEDGEALLEVEDTGIGMEANVVERIFKPFRQASEGLAREYEGTGVGLAVTKEAVDQMGGTIEVETEKGEGTCFLIRLPRADVEEESSGPGRGESDEAGGGDTFS